MAQTINKIENGKVEIRETSETRSIYDIKSLKEQREVLKERLAMIENILKEIKEL